MSNDLNKSSHTDFSGLYVPAEILFRKDLIPTEKFLLALFYRREFYINNFTLTNKQIGDILNLKEKYVGELVSNLRRKGCIRVVYMHGSKRVLDINEGGKNV